MLYTSLKKNKQENIDICWWYEETISAVANLFDKNGEYYSEDNPYFEKRNGYNTDYTDFTKLNKDFGEKEVEKIVFNKIKEMAKQSNNEIILRHKTFFIEIDGLWDVVAMTDDGLLKKSDLIAIRDKAKRKGFDMTSYDDYEYFEYSKKTYKQNGIEMYKIKRRIYGINDLINQAFPCKEESVIDEDGDEYYICIHCGNCD